MNVLTWDWSSKTIPAFSGPCTLLPAAFLRSVASCSATWHLRSKASSQSNRENEKAMDGRIGVAGSSSIWWGLLHHFHMDKTWHCVGPLLHAYTLHKNNKIVQIASHVVKWAISVPFCSSSISNLHKVRVKYWVKAAYVIINFVMNSAGPPRTLDSVTISASRCAVPHPLCT